MMAAERHIPHLIDRLPMVRGGYEADADLSKLTWFRTGGPAEVLYRPADVEDLQAFLRGCPAEAPLTVIGVGSNLLIRDGGVAGVAIRLPKAFAGIRRDGARLICGGAALDITVAGAARDAGLDGMAFLRGIPGTIGGAVAMNGGAYGREISDILISAKILTRAGELRELRNTDFAFGYRKAHLPEGAIVIEAALAGAPGDKAAIQAEMDKIAAEREGSQPLRTRTGGSTFKNPDPAVSNGRRAWQLIDEVGCRGLKVGGAQVSEKHCNFLINAGDATAADIESLGETVRKRVKEKTGVTLEWEIRRIGRPAGGAA